MARHQIIYTSCMRGIDGVNDGQQIFSYDRSFQDCKSDEVKGLFTYQIPSLAPGVIMTEEIAKTMPSSFNYKLLKSGDSAVTLNTYLGRDYMGSAGRFGNHLSHSIVCDFADFNLYPCELFGSASLRDRMEYEEVNNPNPPEYLSEPDLDRGYLVDPDSIIEFLSIKDNLEYFKRMVVAMLRFPREKKRVVICDEKENTIKWIAALHYALPLDIAKKVNFSSYDYDPELSSSRICGVVSEGTRYNAPSYASSGRHYVFDFINHQFSDVEYDENSFLFFLDTAFSFSYESLTDFREFITSKTTYREASEDYYAGFYLYNLLTEGIGELSIDEFRKVISFVDQYTVDSIKRDIITKLIEEKEKINEINNEFVLSVLGFMLKSMDILNPTQQMDVKQMIVERLIFALSDNVLTQDLFMPLYDNLDEMARSIELSLPAELMLERNRDSLLSVLEQKVELWKVRFIVRIISDYVKDIKLSVEELYPNRAIGAIYYEIVRMVYASGRQNGYNIMESILDNFKENSFYFVNMALNIDGYLLDLQLSEIDKQHLWEYVTRYVVTTEDEYRNSVIKELLEYEHCEEVYQVFLGRMEAVSNLSDARNIFCDEFHHLFSKNESYGKSYAAEAVKVYEGIFEKRIGEVSNDEGFKYARELAHIAIQMQIQEEYINDIMLAVCEYIPLEKPSSDNRKMIEEIFEYQRDVLKRPIEGKLLLLIIGITLDQVTKRRDIKSCTDKLLLVADPKGADLKKISTEDAKEYFDWSLSNILTYGLEADDYAQIFQLFDMSKSIHNVFMEYCCKVTYKQSKGDKDYGDFAEFLSFMFTNGIDEDREMVGKYLCKLSKQKLEDLDEEMKMYFKRDRKATHAWESVREVAANTNPLLNNIAGLFRRK